MKKSILLMSTVFALFLTACSMQAPTPPSSNGEEPPVTTNGRVLTAQEAYDRMQSGAPLVIVDVRTAQEYAEGHIPGAILLPNEEIGDTPPAILPVLDTEILLYCRSGNRSAQAAKKLVDMGYTNVFDFGGINSWPYDTQSGDYVLAEKAGTLSSFTSYDLDGLMVDEQIFADYDLTMVNIWATFCGPCLREMPDLGELSTEYADKGLQIVGIVADVPINENGTFSANMVNTARELVDQTGASYLHLLPSADLLSAKLHQVNTVPETIFVDRQGQLVGDSYGGARSKDKWVQIIDTLLEQVKQ